MIQPVLIPGETFDRLLRVLVDSEADGRFSHWKRSRSALYRRLREKSTLSPDAADRLVSVLTFARRSPLAELPESVWLGERARMLAWAEDALDELAVGDDASPRFRAAA